MNNFDTLPKTTLDEIIAGGCTLQVRVLDSGINDWKTEVLKVRKVSKAKVQEYGVLNSGGDMLALAECLTGKPKEWLEALHDDDFERVLEEGRRLNFTSLRAFYRQRTATIQLVEQFSQEVSAAVKQALESAGSQSGTPKE